MLSALLLFLGVPWLAAPQATVPAASARLALPRAGPPARVELLEGRATLAREGGVVDLVRGERGLWVDGEAYLELRPLSRVALRWNATASLIVHGPAVLEWGPLEGSRALFEWRFLELEQAHLEVRRGPLRLVFPGGWRGTVESGAGFLRGLPGGGVEWHHDAGLPILLAAPHGPGEVRPPWVVLAGAWLRLRPGLAHPEMLTGSGARLLDPYARQGSGPPGPDDHPAWGGFAWPWQAAGTPAPSSAAPVVPGAPAGPTAEEPASEAGGSAVGSAAGAAPGGTVEATPPAAAERWRSGPPRPFVDGGVLRLTPWGVRRFREPR